MVTKCQKDNAIFMQTSLILKKLLTNMKYYCIIIHTCLLVSTKTLKEDVLMFENVKDFLVDELRVKPEDVTMEAELAGDLGINSLELAELALRCDEEFGVEIEDEDIHRLITVGDVANYIEEKTA